MSVDFTKFPFGGLKNPLAATLTDAIRSEPLDCGYVVVAIKLHDTSDFSESVRSFAHALRAEANTTGLMDILAFREIRSDELGGSVPFDQAICDDTVRNATRRFEKQPDRYPTIMPALKMAVSNDLADWILFLEFETHDQARAAVTRWKQGQSEYQQLTKEAKSHLACSFRNAMRYANVSRDPNAIQFFNLFPGPGDLSTLWSSWQEALPWFFEIGEFRSSFPLVALDADQSLLVVNYAHCDSMKHFLLGVEYDPGYLETVTRCYSDRGFKLPSPFFCKIVPV